MAQSRRSTGWHADCGLAVPMKTSPAVLMVLAGLGCREELTVTPPPDEPPQFDCASTQNVTFCDDFNAGDATAWAPEAGSWSVIEGRYVGMGPVALDPSQCATSLMTASLRTGSAATDLTVHAELGSEARLDKTIVLRAVDGRNRIELNFRGAPLDDLVVQELVDCELVFHTTEGEVHVPQPEGERITVLVTLRGQHLTVTVADQIVLDRDFTFANVSEGLAGVAVIDSAITTFDSVWMTRL